jgi:hypothetical protein
MLTRIAKMFSEESFFIFERIMTVTVNKLTKQKQLIMLTEFSKKVKYTN